MRKLPYNLQNEDKNGLLFHQKVKETVLKELPLYEIDDVHDELLLSSLFRDYTFLATAYLLEVSHLRYLISGEYGIARNFLP